MKNFFNKIQEFLGIEIIINIKKDEIPRLITGIFFIIMLHIVSHKVLELYLVDENVIFLVKLFESILIILFIYRKNIKKFSKKKFKSKK